jgi:phosphatidylglycerol:prolipoprotein diacylglycerol transferase
MFLTIPYPAIRPEIFVLGPYHLGGWELGPFAIRWYAMAYIAGLVIGWRYCVALAKRPPLVVKPSDVDDFLTWATLGVVLGGRLGYVLFYQPSQYLANPLAALEVWHGGMSFHGGALGVIIAMLLFCRQRGISFFSFGDIIVCAVPIGLFFGRIANFINGELWGRASDVPWAMVFPTGGSEPRHPSQLYEAGLEGILLFLIINILERTTRIRDRPGALGGVFLIGYGLARIIVEFFRQPDSFLGYLAFGWLTMGQILSLPLIIAGLILLLRPQRRAAAAGHAS